ncbi:MAG: peptidoglycan editing factor PgeF [Oscillospiraceae bacterium]|nr:peptidoglycan editing factor PgeF [Oscillospiraceae bacterium]
MAIIKNKQGQLEYLTADGIAAPHCFTTRLGGVSQGTLSSLNIGMHRGDAPENVEENYRILSSAIGFDPQKTVLTRQIHTDVVRVVTAADHCGFDHRDYPECDGLITNTPGTTLVIFTADCTPILLYDPVSGAVGACHAGWRGTAADIAGKTVGAMCAQFGCDPKNIRAAIGPNLGECCFETDADVPDAMRQTFGEAAEQWIRPVGNKFYVNLKEMNALALRRAGVEHIEISDHCTMCLHETYWSHRYTRGVRGSQGAIITCKEVGK